MPLALPHTAVAAVPRRARTGCCASTPADVAGGVVELRVWTGLGRRRRDRAAGRPTRRAWCGRCARPATPVAGADVHLLRVHGAHRRRAVLVRRAGGGDGRRAERPVRAGASRGWQLPGCASARRTTSSAPLRDHGPDGVGLLRAEGHALFLDARDLTQRQVPFDLAAEGLRLLVVDTRVKHAPGDGAYANRRAACESAARALGVPALRERRVRRPWTRRSPRSGGVDDAVRRRVRHVVTENRAGRAGRSSCWTRATPGPSARS